MTYIAIDTEALGTIVDRWHREGRTDLSELLATSEHEAASEAAVRELIQCAVERDGEAVMAAR